MDKKHIIIVQNREDSEYNDFIGILYHFPSKYKNMIKEGANFIYYEPERRGKGVYFGKGQIKKIFDDKTKEGSFYAIIEDYKEFKKEIPLKKENELFENEAQYNPQNAVRYTTQDVYNNILEEAKFFDESNISFKTRARTVDMLGRQQIAGIPTAINELFKNAHDAYADNVIVDYYISDGLFVLRDDGLGMTKDDFINRWLTLGTDSKVNQGSSLTPPPLDPTRELRPSMGEKGIGRLAVSIIGSQVLILTRAKRFDENKEERLHDTVAAFINWRMFEVPGVNIEDITIPIKTFKGGLLPTKDDINEMLNDIRDNINKIEKTIQSELFDIIKQELDNFTLNPAEEAEYLKEPNLKEISGTHFYILPSDKIILEDLNISDTEVSKLKKHLLGFTNTMTPDHNIPKIKASFREHNKSDDIQTDIIEEDEFFTPKDFSNADHRFKGTFDEYGQFHGEITIYGQEPITYQLPWKGSTGKETFCGQFKIDFSTIQGNPSETSVPINYYSPLRSKCEKVGGLYIYKNGIRVLPYGDNDFDFLDIEKRRSMNAGTAYFSYRRMFGAIEINHNYNKELKEKAGREGFQENKAYRQFRAILINFLKKLAEDFIQDKGIYSETFIKLRQEFKKDDEARKKRAKRKKDKENNFIQDFKQAFNDFTSMEHINKIENIKNKLFTSIERIMEYEDSEKIALNILNLESNTFKEINDLEKRYIINRPQGVSLGKTIEKEVWIPYQAELNNAIETVFNPAKDEMEHHISIAIQNSKIEIDRRKRIEQSLNTIIEETKKDTNKDNREISKKKEEVEIEIKKATKESMKKIEEVIRSVSEDFNTTDFSGMSEEDIAKKRLEYENKIDGVVTKEKKTLNTIQTLLEGVSWEFDDEGNIVSDLDIYASHEAMLTETQEQLRLDTELAQIGTAINIINHEFDSSIRTVRKNLRQLKAWAEVNENLGEIYENVRSSFEHIDGYLTLFTPMNRRLYRNKIEIKGHKIYDFIHDLFKVRLDRHDVKLIVTDEFKKHFEIGFPSTFYPTFVNLVDNAIYWLKNSKIENKTISFEIRKGNFVIADTGPGIRDELKTSVFELGFSTKDGGRGMGLYIAKQSLNELGFDLKLLDSNIGCVFEISNLGEINE